MIHSVDWNCPKCGCQNLVIVHENKTVASAKCDDCGDFSSMCIVTKKVAVNIDLLGEEN